MAAIETAEAFGLRLYTEAWRRGWSRAKKKVILGDGAVWIWNLAGQHFPNAIQIVDLYHARQHLWELSAKVFATEPQARKRWAGKLQPQAGSRKSRSRGESVARVPATPGGTRSPLLGNAAEYFERNTERMRYPQFRAQGLFVGSGVVEADSKTVVATRLKQSGMFWTVRGANDILALRCHRLSAKFEDYWETRARAAWTFTNMSHTQSLLLSKLAD